MSNPPEDPLMLLRSLLTAAFLCATLLGCSSGYKAREAPSALSDPDTVGKDVSKIVPAKPARSGKAKPPK
jgi:hypothetical protein